MEKEMEYLAEDLEMEVDTTCDCGRGFDFFSGNRCMVCGEIFCETCVEEHLTLCSDCEALEA